MLQIVQNHPGILNGTDEKRLDLLRIIVRELNTSDSGNWGLLQKNDQGGKIPADIIVWRPTREHFDVLTDTGATWIDDGILINLAWQWLEVGGVSPEPNPTPQPEPQPIPPSVDLSAITQLLNSVIALQQELREKLTQMDSLFQQVDEKTEKLRDFNPHSCYRGKFSYFGTVTLCPVQ